MNEVFRFTLLRAPKAPTAEAAGPVIGAYSNDTSPFLASLEDRTATEMAELAEQFAGSGDYVGHWDHLKIPLEEIDRRWRSPLSVSAKAATAMIESELQVDLDALVQSENFHDTRRRVADSLLAAALTSKKRLAGQERLVRARQLLAAIESLAEHPGDDRRFAAALSAIVVLPKPGGRTEKEEEQKEPDQPPRMRAAIRPDAKELAEIVGAADELERIHRRKAIRGRSLLKGSVENEERAGADRLEKADFALLSDTSKDVFTRLSLPVQNASIPILSQQLKDYVTAESIGTSLLNLPFFFPIFPLPIPAESVPSTIGKVRVAGIGDLLILRQRILRYEKGEIAHIENALRGESFARTFTSRNASEIVEFEELETSETSERDLQSTSKFELKLETEKTIEEDLKFEAGVTVTARGPMIEVGANAGFSYERSTEDSVKTATTFARDVVDRSVSKIQERVLQRRSSRVTKETEEVSEHRIENSDNPDHMVGVYRWIEKIYEAQVVNYGQRLILEFVVPEPAAFFRSAQTSKRLSGVDAIPPESPEVRDAATGKLRPLTVNDITEVTYLDWVAKYDVKGVSPPPPDQQFIGLALEQGVKEGSRDSSSAVVEQSQFSVPPGYVAKSITMDWAGEADDSERNYWEVIVGTKEFIHVTDDTSFTTPSTVDLGAGEAYDANIPVSMVVKNFGSFTANVIVECERTPRKLEEWKLQTFDSIMSRYARLKADYDDAVAAAEIQQGVGISGRDPQSNREAERNELKRLSIAMITGQNFNLFDAMGSSGAPLDYPEISDLSEAEREGDYIQFFEQAFEWHHMTYVFYPYFWGRKSGWLDVLGAHDNDPLFAQFLRAGAARVQVPVRPGFVDAIDLFLKEGKLWNGREPPHFNDNGDDASPPFLPIIQELREQTGNEFVDGPGTLRIVSGESRAVGSGTSFTELRDLDREIRIDSKVYRIVAVTDAESIEIVPPFDGTEADRHIYALGPVLVGQPWEVRLPTNLVMLQEDASLPVFD